MVRSALEELEVAPCAETPTTAISGDGGDSASSFDSPLPKRLFSEEVRGSPQSQASWAQDLEVPQALLGMFERSVERRWCEADALRQQLADSEHQRCVLQQEVGHLKAKLLEVRADAACSRNALEEAIMTLEAKLERSEATAGSSAEVARNHEKSLKAALSGKEQLLSQLAEVRADAACSRNALEEAIMHLEAKLELSEAAANFSVQVASSHEQSLTAALSEKEQLQSQLAAIGEAIAAAFCCPLAMTTMLSPVTGSDGRTYESSSIQCWLCERGTSPYTRQRMQLQDLVPNLSLAELREQLAPHFPVLSAQGRPPPLLDGPDEPLPAGGDPPDPFQAALDFLRAAHKRDTKNMVRALTQPFAGLVLNASYFGLTLLHMAVFDDMVDVVAALLSREDFTMEMACSGPEANGPTALHFAAAFGRPRMCAMIVARVGLPGLRSRLRADVNDICRACKDGEWSLVDIRAAAGSSPIDLARTMGHAETVALLERLQRELSQAQGGDPFLEGLDLSSF